MIQHFKRLFQSLLFLFIFACSQKNDSKTIQLDDIRPQASQQKPKQQQEKEDSSEIELKVYQDDSIKLNFKYLTELKNTNFINRFPNVKAGFRKLCPSDTTIEFFHEFYLYKDSLQMKNAFFNWLDCYGKNCQSIKLYEEIKIESTNLLVLCTPKSIDIIRGNQNLNPETWLNFVRFKRKYEDFKFILFQKKNQKSKWFEYKNQQLIQVKRK